MRILLIDGQGGRMGKELCARILSRFPGVDLVCVGTNSMATAVMLKGGATAAATGENAICVCAKEADLIVGPDRHRDCGFHAGGDHPSHGARGGTEPRKEDPFAHKSL